MGRLSEDMLGTWELTFREDRAEDGTLVPEHTLGPNPKGMLIYDRGGNFAAQFMKLDRSAALLGVALRGQLSIQGQQHTGSGRIRCLFWQIHRR
jgi:hypothetical protein